MIALRPYQQAAIARVIAAWQSHPSTLVVSATGTGKTETFLGLLSQLQASGEPFRTLILVHRQDLVRQIAARIAANWPDLDDGGFGVGIVAEGACDFAKSLTIATVQSMQPRIEAAVAYGPYTHIVIDEAHHATAPTYRSIIAACPGAKLVGFTATPKRSDSAGLKAVFGSVAFRFGIAPAIAAGALVPFRALGFRLDGDLDSIKQSDDDYDDAALVHLLDYSNAYELAVEKYRQHGEDRPAILFAPSVASARKAAAAFEDAGIESAVVSADTPRDAREAIYSDFRANSIKILCNCFLLTEGMDFPAASCLLQLRPTKSDLVYVQMAGRVLRTSPGKQDALILDFVPAAHREMVLAGDLLGKPKQARKLEAAAEQRGVLLQSFSVTAAGEGIDGEPDDLKLAILDYLQSSILTWTVEGRVATASLGQRALAVLMPDDERRKKADALRQSGQWQPKFDLPYQNITNYCLYLIENKEVSLLSRHQSWEGAQQAAMAATEEYLTESDHIIAATGRKWRKLPPSEKQIALLQKLGRNTDGLDKGKASQMVTHVFTISALRKAQLL